MGSQKSSFVWQLLALTCLFGGASIINLGSLYDPLDPLLSATRFALIAIGLGSLSFFLPSAFMRFRPTMAGMTIIALWVTFGLVCLLSSIVTNDQPEAVASSLWLLLGVPFLFLMALPGVLGRDANKLLIVGLLVSHAAYLTISFCLYPTLRFEYKGIFGHPNAMGLTAAIVSACALVWLVDRVRTGSFRSMGGLTATVIAAASCFLVAVSGSRTSLLAVLLTSAVASVLCSRFARRRYIAFTLLGVLLIFSSGIAFLPDLSIVQQIWLKHSRRVIEGDMLSRRDEIWVKVIDDIRPFGNGVDYFPETIGISSHNSLIHIVGQRGPIAAFLMICIAALAMDRAFRHFLASSQHEAFSAAPLLIAVLFWALSAGEGIFGSFGTGINLAYQLSIGIVLADEPYLRIMACRSQRQLSIGRA